MNPMKTTDLTTDQEGKKKKNENEIKTNTKKENKKIYM